MIRLLLLVIHLVLSSVWFGVAPKTDIMNMCLKETGLRAQNMKTIIGLNSQHNLVGGGGWGI
jgi:hypothetical protein